MWSAVILLITELTRAGCARSPPWRCWSWTISASQPLPEHQQEDLYEVICLALRASCHVVITSNRDFSEWPLVFANPLIVARWPPPA